jgi:hypothetical protein
MRTVNMHSVWSTTFFLHFEGCSRTPLPMAELLILVMPIKMVPPKVLGNWSVWHSLIPTTGSSTHRVRQ